jgi:hypothetical protein
MAAQPTSTILSTCASEICVVATPAFSVEQGNYSAAQTILSRLRRAAERFITRHIIPIKKGLQQCRPFFL